MRLIASSAGPRGDSLDTLEAHARPDGKPLKPGVTGVVPTYGRPGMLLSAVRSALAQTRPPETVLIMDDASPDETPEAAMELLADPRVRYFRQPKNLGLAANWRSGIAMVETEFFFILNDDDFLEPEFIERLIGPLLERPDLILSTCDHWMIGKRCERLPDMTERTSRHWKRDCLNAGPIPDFARSALIDQSVFVGATIFRRSMVPPEFIAPEAKGASDLWLLYQCARTGYPAYFVPERLHNYRSHPGGMSRDRQWRVYFFEGLLYLYDCMLADQKLSRISGEIAAKHDESRISLGIALVSEGRNDRALELFKGQWKVRHPWAGALWEMIARLGAPGTWLLRVAQRIRSRMTDAALVQGLGAIALLSRWGTLLSNG